ncbi:MAG: alpha/beta hydrolase [Pyrinomonadaceae bacterium]|nr:alpha/beta hydrolase-fold protein [Acidobacteriota bacterium]
MKFEIDHSQDSFTIEAASEINEPGPGNNLSEAETLEAETLTDAVSPLTEAASSLAVELLWQPEPQIVLDEPPARTGNFRAHKNFHSAFLAHDRDVLVYLPPGYDAGAGQHYPVLYLHDGQNLFDPATAFIPGQDWHFHQTAEALIAAEAIEPLIIVGIYNTGTHRIDEYTPVKDTLSKIGGQADRYGRMLVEELKPLIDAEYRTLPNTANTGLGGSSLGGLVTLYLGLKYPHVFGKLAVISPAIWWGRRIILRYVHALRTKPELRIWLDMGTHEGGNTLRDAALLRDALIARGFKLEDDLKYLEVAGAHHSEQDWAQRVAPILSYLFPR